MMSLSIVNSLPPSLLRIKQALKCWWGAPTGHDMGIFTVAVGVAPGIGTVSNYRTSPEFVLDMQRQIIFDGRARCLLTVSSRGVRRVTRLVPLATACSKMLLSSLFFGAGCWLCLFSPFRTDHRKQLRTRSVATQQRLRMN